MVAFEPDASAGVPAQFSVPPASAQLHDLHRRTRVR
jgi:hypothetical protein